jgi:hypothetical protein
MRGYRTGNGRKKAVKEFRIQDGLWMILLISGGMMAIVLLWLTGFFRFDEH